jgi:hypothetical protein
MNVKTERYVNVAEHWKLRKGKNEYLKHLNDERLTRTEAMTAKCYECNAGYDDDKPGDCNVPACPLHQYMPYRADRNKRDLTPEQRQVITDRLHNTKAA